MVKVRESQNGEQEGGDPKTHRKKNSEYHRSSTR